MGPGNDPTPGAGSEATGVGREGAPCALVPQSLESSVNSARISMNRPAKIQTENAKIERGFLIFCSGLNLQVKR